MCVRGQYSSPLVFIKPLYLQVHRLLSSGPLQTALFKEALSPIRQAPRHKPATLLLVLSLSMRTQREFLLFCVSQFIVVIFFSSGLTNTQYLTWLERQNSWSTRRVVRRRTLHVCSCSAQCVFLFYTEG